MNKINEANINGNDNALFQNIINSTIYNNSSGEKLIINNNITGISVDILPEEYIEREEIECIRKHFSEGNKTLMLINGEGGIGKTTLAAKYLQNSRNNYKHFAWLLCEQSIEEQIMSLSFFLKIDYKKKQEHLHSNILINELNRLPGKKLLILDNANNADDIRKFTKNFGGLEWDILITSRCNNAVEAKNELKIEHLPPIKAIELFKRIYKEEKNDFEEQLNFLLNSIGYNTLLIVLFSKYMKERNRNKRGSYHLLDLIKEYRKEGMFSGDKQVKIIHQKDKTNINIIIEKLYNLSDLSEEEDELLIKFSLFPLEPVSYNQISEILQPPKNIELENALTALHERGWLIGSEIQEGISYKMNQVVQQFILNRNSDIIWEKAFPIAACIRDLLNISDSKENPLDKFQWRKFGESILNVFSIGNKSEFISTKPELFVLQNNLGLIFEKQGDYIRARELMESSLKSAIAYSGEADSNISIYMNNLANVYCELGEFNKALEFAQKAIDFAIKKYGESDYNVAQFQNSLALIYMDIGENEKAEALLERAVKTCESLFREDFLNLAVFKGNLGLVYTNLDKYQRAKELLEYVVKFYQGSSYADFPDIATHLNNLANVYIALGDYEKAINLLMKALKIDIKNFGEDHPNVAYRCNNLATIYTKLDDYETAIKLSEDALNIIINRLGVNHPVTGKFQNNLGSMYRRIGELEKARKYIESAMQIGIDNFGKNHINVAFCMSELGSVFSDLGEYEKARQLIEEAVNIQIEKLGENHHSVAITLSNLVNLYIYRKDFIKARELIEKSIKINILNFGDNHTDVLKMRNKLGITCFSLGEVEYAKKLLEENLVLLIERLGENHSDVSVCKSYLGSIYNKLHEYNKAIELLEKDLIFKIKIYGERNAEVAIVMNNLAFAYMNSGQGEKAVELWKEAYQIALEKLGEEHQHTKIYKDFLNKFQNK